MQTETLIIIGSGPAGLTAALYAARANLNPLVIAGNQIGGQIAITSDVENFPGFDNILGPDLTEKMKAQAEKFGARIEYDEVTEVDFTHGRPFRLKTYSQEYEAQAVIVATGASAKRLRVPGEDAPIGRGVSYCATCDGFFFKGKDVLVVHTACPWMDSFRAAGLPNQCGEGCDRWFQVAAQTISPKVRVVTESQLPRGGDTCTRRFTLIG